MVNCKGVARINLLVSMDNLSLRNAQLFIYQKR